MAKVSVNWDAIKLKTYKVAARKVEPMLKDILENGADQFVGILLEEMGNAPDSVKATAASLSVDDGSVDRGVGFWVNQYGQGWFKRGEITVSLTFQDNPGRPAFGHDAWLDNIVALFDRGYTITGPRLPSGEWHGGHTVALRSRQGLNFMLAALRRARREIEGVRDATAE